MIVECPACESRYDVTGRPPGTKARCRCSQIFTLPEPTHYAKVLHCPQCGGAVAQGDSQCVYCEAALLVKACPRCFCRVFHGAKHCEQCGAAVDKPANANEDGSAKQLGCPRCENSPTMIARLIGDILLDECTLCHGVWLDTCSVDRLVRERRQVSTQAALGVGQQYNTNELSLTPPAKMYVKCPECATIMNRTNFARSSGIILDTCRGHGTWFDALELPRIVEFVMNGGIESSQEHEMKRMTGENKRELAKIRAIKSMQFAPTSVNAFTGILGAIGKALLK